MTQPPAKQPQPQQQRPPPSIEEQLAQMPQLLDSERQWARKHPDLFSDPNQLKILEGAYLKWQRSGQPRGSPEYFRYFDQELGYNQEQPAAVEYDDHSPAPQQEQPSMQQRPPAVQQQRPIAAAPVSRVPVGVERRETYNSGQVTLSPAEREAARFSKITEKEYARNKARLIEEKRRGLRQETG